MDGEAKPSLDPLQPVPMPTHAVLVSVSTNNSFAAPEPAGGELRLAYIATNSTQRIAFVSVQAGGRSAILISVATRPSLFADLPYGIVVELRLAVPLAAGETILLTFAQAGATKYYPPQPIDDRR